jgi:hypothetical protein
MSRLNQCTEGQLFDYAIIQEFTYIVPPGVVLADLIQPSHWAQVWRKLARSKWPKIQCIADDGSWEATLRVVSVSDGMAKVRVIAAWGDTEAAPSRPAVVLPEGVSVEHIPGQGWRGLFNKQIIIEKQGVEDDAVAAVVAHAARASGGAAEPAPAPVVLPPSAPVSVPVTEPEVGVTGHPSRKSKKDAA